MAIIINGATGIDMGNTSVSNASQVDSVIINENGLNVATNNNLVGFKNYVINGNFDVWQYGTSQTTSGYGSDDRWNNNNNGSTKTHSQITCTDTERALFNASKFSRTVVSSVVGAGYHAVKHTSIEDVTKLAGKTITISFWAKADSNKNIWLEFQQNFGIGGSPSTAVIGIYGQSIALTPTWQKKTITLTLPSIIGKTLGTNGVQTSSTNVKFWFDVGSTYTEQIPNGIHQSGTFDIAQVQLEEGSVATPFENRPYGLELSFCQRYYYKSPEASLVIVKAGGTWSSTSIFFPVQMRVAPTIFMSNNQQGNWSAGANIVTTGSFKVTSNNPDIASCEIQNFAASAEL